VDFQALGDFPSEGFFYCAGRAPLCAMHGHPENIDSVSKKTKISTLTFMDIAVLARNSGLTRE